MSKFNFKNGKVASGSSDSCCWISDGNLWFTSGKSDFAIKNMNFWELQSLLKQSMRSVEDVSTFYYSSDARKIKTEIILEDEDAGERNLVFMSGELFLMFKIKTAYISAFENFIASNK